VSWRAANCLLVFRDQIDKLYPGRNKESDGIIGDAAHQATPSDHNPDEYGVVHAIDITHDPAHGLDIELLADSLCASQDERISYIIANEQITGPGYGWEWNVYFGDDPHTNHLHLSVLSGIISDRTYAWTLNYLGEKLMATASEKIDAMMMGFPSTADGDPVCPTRWQIATEKWQGETKQAITLLSQAVAEIREITAQAQPTIDYAALAKALLAELAK